MRCATGHRVPAVSAHRVEGRSPYRTIQFCLKDRLTVPPWPLAARAQKRGRALVAALFHAQDISVGFFIECRLLTAPIGGIEHDAVPVLRHEPSYELRRPWPSGLRWRDQHRRVTRRKVVGGHAP
jgi:hypothetical protein